MNKIPPSMTDSDMDHSKARMALLSEMQRFAVIQFVSDRAVKDSASVNATAAVYSVDYPQWTFSVVNITVTVFAFLVIFSTLGGNALVIVAVIKERRLRKVSNSFVINLAVSDVLVGVLVTPLALLYQLHGHWDFSRQVCHFWVSMDVICCTASITSLCAISYDRYNAITRPLRYARRRTRRRAIYLIMVIWVYSACIAFPPFVGWGADKDEADSRQCKVSQHAGYTLYSTIGAFYMPLCFMLFAYVCIYRETNKRRKQWRCGPGSSKMISERDCQGSVILPMASLAAERRPLTPSPSCPVTPTLARTGSMRMTPAHASFPRNSSISDLIRREEREEKSMPKDCSSGSDYSITSTSPSLFQTTIQMNGTCRTIFLSSKKLGHPLLRRTYGSCPYKLARQMSNLPSSDSSTATFSSSDLPPPDQSPLEQRFCPAGLRQNADMFLKSRPDMVTPRLGKSGQEQNKGYVDDSFSCVNSLASSCHRPTHGRYENHVTAPVDSTEAVVAPMAKCSRNGIIKARLKQKIAPSQEKRAAKTLSVVLGCFIVCWLPFFVVALLKPLCITCHFPAALDSLVLWLGYCNSALNPVIYTFFNKDFRFAFRNILCCMCRLHGLRRRRRRRRRRRSASL